MVYANVTIKDSDGFSETVKLVANDADAYKSWKDRLASDGYDITDEFVDDDFGTICILPEDFRY